MLSELL